MAGFSLNALVGSPIKSLQRGESVIPLNATFHDTPIAAVNPVKAVEILRGTRGNATTPDQLNCTVTLTSATNVRVERSNGGITDVTVDWLIVEFK